MRAHVKKLLKFRNFAAPKGRREGENDDGRCSAVHRNLFYIRHCGLGDGVGYVFGEKQKADEPRLFGRSCLPDLRLRRGADQRAFEKISA